MVITPEDSSEIAVSFRGGGSFVDFTPVFSSDGDSVFIVWISSMLEYSTKTGKLIYEYKVPDRVVGFSYHIFHSYYCLTGCTENGKVVIWKTVTHTKILELKLPLDRIQTFSIISSEDDKVQALISYKRKNSIRFTIADLMKKSTKDFKLCLPFNKKYKLSPSKYYFAVIFDNVICFVKFDEPSKVSRKIINESRTFTCICSHPSEEIVLAGDSTGRVILWQNIFAPDKIQTVFHWHTLAVQTVCFSPSGSYFYSGGNECVLVKWHIHDANDRKFVPRISAEINQIAVAGNNIFIAVATSDNAIRIFNNALNQTSLIQHLVLGKHFKCGMTYDSRTRALIMNGNQGHLQFYSPDDMSLLYSIDIIGHNKITNERDCVMVNTEITKVALSKSGLWLATVEERKDEKYHDEIRLKFWHFCVEKQIFELNTCIDYPHEESINSIEFQPMLDESELICVTVGDDKQFKVWELVDFQNVYKKSKVWQCLNIGSHRNLPCKALSFSIDGSIIATGFGPILTVWVPETCELKCSLLHPIHAETIKHVQFGYGDQCHLVVSASSDQLSVWNLLTLCMQWTVPLQVSLLINDPVSTLMAVFTGCRRVFVFSPKSHVPIHASGTLLTKKEHKIITAGFFPCKNYTDVRKSWFERSNIYFISSNNELYCIGSSEVVPDYSNDKEYKHSNFSKIIPNEKISLPNPVEPYKHLYEKDMGQKAIKEYLLGPTHTLPPIRYMCYSLLKSLVIQKEQNVVN